MKNKFLALLICLSLLCSLLCACSPTDKDLENSTYKLRISIDIISDNEMVNNCFRGLETTEAEIRVGDSRSFAKYVGYSRNPYEGCYENYEYWLTKGGILFFYVMNDAPKAKVKRLEALPEEDELNLFFRRATFFGGITDEDFDNRSKSGDLLTYTDYNGDRDGYLLDIVFTYSSWLAGDNDFYAEDITLRNVTLSIRLDGEKRYSERVLLCDYRVIAAGVEYEFTLKSTMTYDFDSQFTVLIPDDYLDGKYTLVPYDEMEFSFLRMPGQ